MVCILERTIVLVLAINLFNIFPHVVYHTLFSVPQRGNMCGMNTPIYDISRLGNTEHSFSTNERYFSPYTLCKKYIHI